MARDNVLFTVGQRVGWDPTQKEVVKNFGLKPTMGEGPFYIAKVLPLNRQALHPQLLAIKGYGHQADLSGAWFIPLND